MKIYVRLMTLEHNPFHTKYISVLYTATSSMNRKGKRSFTGTDQNTEVDWQLY